MRVRFFSDVKNRDDSGMRKSAGGFGLTPKAFAKFALCFRRLVGERNRFDCNRAVNLGIASAVNHSHGAAANLIEDLAATEAALGRGIHWHGKAWGNPNKCSEV